MGVRKISIALRPDIAEAASQSAERAGLSLSAWLSRAAEHALALEEGLSAVDEWVAEHGSFTEAEILAAEATLDGSWRD